MSSWGARLATRMPLPRERIGGVGGARTPPGRPIATSMSGCRPLRRELAAPVSVVRRRSHETAGGSRVDDPDRVRRADGATAAGTDGATGSARPTGWRTERRPGLRGRRLVRMGLPGGRLRVHVRRRQRVQSRVHRRRVQHRVSRWGDLQPGVQRRRLLDRLRQRRDVQHRVHGRWLPAGVRGGGDVQHRLRRRGMPASVRSERDVQHRLRGWRLLVGSTPAAQHRTRGGARCRITESCREHLVRATSHRIGTSRRPR